MRCKSRGGLRRGLLLAALALFACCGHAGNISFQLALTGSNLTITHTGDSAAFFPTALAMVADGTWQQLATPEGREAPTQISPGERMLVLWRESGERPSALLHLRPTMVRFFDQAGVGFGQISFFTPPPDATSTLEAGYVRGELRISPPSGGPIVATWVLWPQEEGIAGIGGVFRETVVQPPARRVEWRAQSKPVRLSTGSALPAVTLIHETAQGYRLQRVAAGWDAGKQQRSPWLEANRAFYALALLLAAAAAGAWLLPRWRGGP